MKGPRAASAALARRFLTAAALAVLLAALGPAAGLPAKASADGPARPRPGAARHAWDQDLAAKRALDRDGAFRVGVDVVLWFPADSLTDRQAEAVVTRLDRGVGAARQFLNKPDWQVEGDRRVHFYCAPGNFISHAPGGNCAFIPLWRMREDRSPWLHEAMHLLLATPNGDWLAQEDSVALRRMPLWLTEGLADALSMEISERAHLPWYSPLLDTNPASLDSVAAEALRHAPSNSVLSMIGARGKLPQLFGPDRFQYAVPFYAGSASFTRFIARRYGYGPLLRAIAAFDREQETLAAELGAPLERVKAEWLLEIGYTPGAKPGEGAAR